MVLEELLSGKYDYVIWMDSDTIIRNKKIDISRILSKFSSDIFIGSDNNPKYDITNAGVFFVKNTQIGIQFLKDCIVSITSTCVKEDGSLKGVWAASCYEQGVINILIADKYSKYTTVLPNEIIFNYNLCSDEVFIMHLYNSSNYDRVNCFNSNKKKILKFN